MSDLQLWAGAECTINRVGDRWCDQSARIGAGRRVEDLDRLVALGAKRVRLPVLWEALAPDDASEIDWRWPDAALRRLREARVPAIVGLLHHGSGPSRTHLLDPRFPALFADHAGRVARRYPDQLAWTPINEPLTTARFAALYGLWYPHRSDDRAFVRALLNQVHATVLAMRAIRAVNPAAELVQTDDLGFTRSTPALADQAAFDNERRWLAFDLLAGRVDRGHPLWGWLRGNGAGERELKRLCDAPCPADVIGINAYVTSERFLDERLALHPPRLHGGNGRQAYVDIETVRAHGTPIDGFAGRLREAHARYAQPLAITEVHMGCTREEQMRWLQQAWDDALAARRDGVDVRAVTAWAAFGTMDWNSLLTREAGHYEPGLWDARADPPRLTALGRLAGSLARAEPRDATANAILAGPGWWQRELRLTVPPFGPATSLPTRGPWLLIVGDGALGRVFARLCHLRGLPCELLSRRDLDTTDRSAIEGVLAARVPWAVVDAAGDVRPSHANADGARVLALACARRGIRLLGFSSALRTPRHAPTELVVRSEAFFGPWDAALDLLIDGESGLWHLPTARTRDHETDATGESEAPAVAA